MCFALGVVTLAAACGSTKPAAATHPSAASLQALRTCVDRWNQGNMLSWGSMSVRISIRGLTTRERSRLLIPSPGQKRCTISLAARAGDNTWICLIDPVGGYYCPLVTSDGMPPLRAVNGKTDRRGVLKLNAQLKGTHATPPLAWQRQYPHVDGYISPWTRAGSLRRGLTFDQTGGAKHYRGTCSAGSKQTVAKAALHCVSDVQFDPCFAATARWNHAGTIVACARAGWTRFGRFVITRNS